MSYLLDASAFLDHIRRKKNWVLGQYILDLTLYEIATPSGRRQYFSSL